MAKSKMAKNMVLSGRVLVEIEAYRATIRKERKKEQEGERTRIKIILADRKKSDSKKIKEREKKKSPRKKFFWDFVL